MSSKSWLWLRVLIAGGFGVGLAMIVFYIALGIALANGVFTGEQSATRSYINWMDRTVTDYRAENKTFPPDLRTIWPGEGDKPPLVDGWNRLLLYSTRGNGFLIESLGRDGVRGGVGLDADISNLSSRVVHLALPLDQQLSHPLGHTFALVAFVTGVMAAGLVFLSLGRVPINGASWAALALQLTLTFLLASLMAMVGALFIAVVHIPSGH